MSEFDSAFWGYYVAIPTLLGIAGLCWLMLACSKRAAPNETIGDTGHVWDEDLREMNNPLPRWWMNLFFITAIFGVIYLFLYPGLVLIQGSLKFTNAGSLEADQAAVAASAQKALGKYATMDVKQIADDPAAMKVGQKAFLNYCSQCHGSDAGGAPGFPNLTDTDWLWGGEPEQIKQTILQGRNGVMPALGSVVKGDDAVAVAHYVRKLSGLKHDEVKASTGKPLYVSHCAACHSAEGTGNIALGAPNLTHPSKIWLYGSDVDTIVYGITNGRNNAMPAHQDILPPELVPIVTSYVWSLSGKTK